MKNFGGASLIAARSLKRAQYIILLNLRQVRFEINSLFRQIKLGYIARLVLEYALGQPLWSDATISDSGRRPCVFAPAIKADYPAVLQRDCTLDCVLKLAHVARPV